VSVIRRLTIARDGTVKHKGQPTRWFVEWDSEGCCWVLYRLPEPYSRRGELWCAAIRRYKLYTYLDAMSDSDLLTAPDDLAKRTLQTWSAEA